MEGVRGICYNNLQEKQNLIYIYAWSFCSTLAMRQSISFIPGSQDYIPERRSLDCKLQHFLKLDQWWAHDQINQTDENCRPQKTSKWPKDLTISCSSRCVNTCGGNEAELALYNEDIYMKWKYKSHLDILSWDFIRQLQWCTSFQYFASPKNSLHPIRSHCKSPQRYFLF